MDTRKFILRKVSIFSSWKVILVWKLFSLYGPKRISRYFLTKWFVTNILQTKKEIVWYLLKWLSKRLTNPFTKGYSKTKQTIQKRLYLKVHTYIWWILFYLKGCTWMFLPWKYWFWEEKTKSLWILRRNIILKSLMHVRTTGPFL